MGDITGLSMEMRGILFGMMEGCSIIGRWQTTRLHAQLAILDGLLRGLLIGGNLF